MSNVRPGANTVGSILYDVYLIELTPLYWRRTSDVPISGEVFYGRTDGRTADEKRRKNLILGLPVKAPPLIPRTECINVDQIFKDVLLQIKQRQFILFKTNKCQLFISEIAIVKLPSFVVNVKIIFTV